MTRVTMAVPVAHIAAANELAACLGYSEADRLTFTLAPIYVDGEGQGYAVASSVVQVAFLQDAVAPLVEPEWGADMAQAAAAQAMIVLDDGTGEGVVLAAPDKITAVVGEDAEAAVAAMGLVRVEAGRKSPLRTVASLG